MAQGVGCKPGLQDVERDRYVLMRLGVLGYRSGRRESGIAKQSCKMSGRQVSVDDFWFRVSRVYGFWG